MNSPAAFGSKFLWKKGDSNLENQAKACYIKNRDICLCTLMGTRIFADFN